LLFPGSERNRLGPHLGHKRIGTHRVDTFGCTFIESLEEVAASAPASTFPGSPSGSSCLWRAHGAGFGRALARVSAVNTVDSAGRAESVGTT